MASFNISKNEYNMIQYKCNYCGYSYVFNMDDSITKRLGILNFHHCKKHNTNTKKHNTNTKLVIFRKELDKILDIEGW